MRNLSRYHAHRCVEHPAKRPDARRPAQSLLDRVRERERVQRRVPVVEFVAFVEVGDPARRAVGDDTRQLDRVAARAQGVYKRVYARLRVVGEDRLDQSFAFRPAPRLGVRRLDGLLQYLEPPHEGSRRGRPGGAMCSIPPFDRRSQTPLEGSSKCSPHVPNRRGRAPRTPYW